MKSIPLLFMLLGALLISSTMDKQLLAQEPTHGVEQTKSIERNEGIYLSFKAYQDNQVDITWEEVQGEINLLRNGNLARVSAMQYKEVGVGKNLNINKIWGFVWKDNSYIQVENVNSKTLFDFARLQSKAPLMYFAYPSREKRKVKFTAYNPITQQAFRKSEEERVEWVEKEKILHFERGEILDYTFENMKEITQKDPVLYRALIQLEDYELKEKMMKVLRKYNERQSLKINE